jgi:hypothetical protein
MDADDVMLPTRIERQLAFVAANDQVVITSCMGYLIDEDGRRIGQTTSQLLTSADFERHLSKQLWFDIANSGVLMKYSAFMSVGGYRTQFRYLEDADLWFRIAEHGGLILVQPERLMYYRKRRGSVSARSLKKLREPLVYGHWVDACRAARCAGLPEPTFAEWRAAAVRQPLSSRLNLRRHLRAEYWYRVAVLNYSSGRALNAARYATGAMALRPWHFSRLVARKLDRRGVQERARIAVARASRLALFGPARR